MRYVGEFSPVFQACIPRAIDVKLGLDLNSTNDRTSDASVMGLSI